MVELTGPADVTQISVEQENFTVNKNGNFSVPEIFVAKLVDIGFKRVPARIRVSQEAADAIAASSKKLNLPTPHLTIVNEGGKVGFVSDGTPQGDLDKFLMVTSGGNFPDKGDWTTVGRDASGFPVPKGSPEDVTNQAAGTEKTAEQIEQESQEHVSQEAADAAKAKETTGAGEGGAGEGDATQQE